MKAPGTTSGLSYAALLALALVLGCETADALGGDVRGDAGAQHADAPGAQNAGRDEIQAPTCSPAPRPGFCMTAGTWLEPWGDGVDFSVDGEVVETGDGYPHEAPENVCQNEVLSLAYDDDDAVRSWLRLDADDGQEWWVAIQWPEHAASFTVGERLHIDYHDQEEPWGPDTGRVALSRADGELVLWLAIAGSADDLMLPEDLSVTAGPARCAESSECGDWELYDFELTAEDETKPLPYGDAVNLGRYHVVHCGAELQSTAEVQCMDWFVAFAGVFLSAPACGGPLPDPACSTQLGQQDCEAHGGTYEARPSEPWREGICWCPIGDAGCPCTNARQCQGYCRGDDEDCEATEVGVCRHDREWLQQGCVCVADPFDLTDSFSIVCAD